MCGGDHFTTIALEHSEVEAGELRAAIDVDKLAGIGGGQFGDPRSHGVIHDAPVRFDELVEHDEAIALTPDRCDSIADPLRRVGGQRLAVADVEPI